MSVVTMKNCIGSCRGLATMSCTTVLLFFVPRRSRIIEMFGDDSAAVPCQTPGIYNMFSDGVLSAGTHWRAAASTEQRKALARCSRLRSVNRASAGVQRTALRLVQRAALGLVQRDALGLRCV